MADMNEKRTQQSTGQQAGQQGGQQRQSTQQSGQQSGAMQAREQGQRSGRMTRRGLSVPSMFALGPGAALSFSPFELMRRFTDEMDRVFEDFGLARGPEFGAGEIEMWAPSVEVFERDNNLVVRAELPGMTRADQLAVVTPQENASEALNRLERRNVRQVPVVQDVRLVGLLRRRDIMRWLQTQSEFATS